MSSRHENFGAQPSADDRLPDREASSAAEGAAGSPDERIRHAKREWESSVDALSQIVCLLDARGRVQRANRAVETWGLASVTRARDLNLHELLHPGCRDPQCYL
jgi:PAS domain-containing protein